MNLTGDDENAGPVHNTSPSSSVLSRGQKRLQAQFERQLQECGRGYLECGQWHDLRGHRVPHSHRKTAPP